MHLGAARTSSNAQKGHRRPRLVLKSAADHSRTLHAHGRNGATTKVVLIGTLHSDRRHTDSELFPARIAGAAVGHILCWGRAVAPSGSSRPGGQSFVGECNLREMA